MKHLQLAIIALLIFAGANQANAQWNTPWTVGVGSNFIYDGNGGGLFRMQETWHIFHKSYIPIPSRLNVEKEIGNGFSVEVVGSYNSFGRGKPGPAFSSANRMNYFALDFHAKYNFDELLGGGTPYFSPFVYLGYGYFRVGEGTRGYGTDYTEVPSVGSLSSNIGFGWTTWLTPQLGLQFQTVGKFINNKKTSNHIQHSGAIVIRFGGDNDFGKKRYDRVVSGDAKSAQEHIRRILNK
ncbi:MAG: hypothetical protein H0X62_11735 [Bacteroidetes bacterium]|nr:hypothetical protein [Bacteroidota bacterium]